MEDEKAYENKFKTATHNRPNWAVIAGHAQRDPSLFAKWYLDVTPYIYQDQILNDRHKRIAVCSSRQIGKTFVVVMKALHYAMYNKKKRVLVFSKNQKQANKFLRDMKSMMHQGMTNINRLNQSDKAPFKLDEDPAYIFPEDFDKTQPNNMTEFTLTNGSVVMSLPATDSSRGYTADLVIVDEAGFVPDDIFDAVIEPTVRHTGGAIILLSTPNGQKGFFHRYFDPEDRQDNEDREYKRYWWNWELCPEEAIREVTLKKRKQLDHLLFAQEYEAQFTVDADAFFDTTKTKKAINRELELIYEGVAGVDYVCGIDYGLSRARTVISLTHLDEETNTIILDFQKEFPAGYDNGKLPDFLYDLELRFNIVNYVVDDCPQGDTASKMLEDKGKPVRLFKFGRSAGSSYSTRGTNKATYFFRFRAALFRKDEDEGRKFRMPLLEQLQNQMFTMQLKTSPSGATLIEKPEGGFDDRVDSLMLSCVPFLDEYVREVRSWCV